MLVVDLALQSFHSQMTYPYTKVVVCIMSAAVNSRSFPIAPSSDSSSIIPIVNLQGKLGMKMQTSFGSLCGVCRRGHSHYVSGGEMSPCKLILPLLSLAVSEVKGHIGGGTVVEIMFTPGTTANDQGIFTGESRT